ncbi:MAG: Uma2 family endonuclease [Gemmatimonadaceae bacterium]
MATATKRWTIDEVRALPDDGNRYEVVDGELLVTPAPSWRHGDAVLALVKRLLPYLEAHRLGHLKVAPQDLLLGDNVLVQPDVFVVPLVSGRTPRSWDEVRRLLLAIEVLSPGTARADRTVKRALYQRHAVPEYWIVDTDARLVERWRPADDRPEIIAALIDWQPDPTHPSMIIDLPSYFAEVTGD